MMETQQRQAVILEREGKRWWRCPCCRKTMGEFVGWRLIVMTHGRTFTFPLVIGMTQTCPHCGQESELGGE
jgi:hypothetical protein